MCFLGRHHMFMGNQSVDQFLHNFRWQQFCEGYISTFATKIYPISINAFSK